ncbi:hypothetical protein ACIGCK_01430 [Microbacterium sp. NPDC078428]|uniref:hypothetical protein n=1 Tax=Microbacterium sp. NPDC078428 TaxID=3364190 RepID=UPI0037C666F7
MPDLAAGSPKGPQSGDPQGALATDMDSGFGRAAPSFGAEFRGFPVVVIAGESDSPDLPTVHDFRNVAVPVLERMHNRRRRVVAKEGFSISTERG